MSVLAKILDFLFPNHETVLRANGVSKEDLADLLPPSISDPDIFAVLPYKDKRVRSLIKALKYYSHKESAETLAEVLYGFLAEELSERMLAEHFVDPLMVPMPLHPSRLRKRGFNQSLLLAKKLLAIDKHVGELEEKALRRTKHTKTQTRKTSKSERVENVRDAFSANEQLVFERNIVLIDDVTTTGATFHEARKELLNKGARKVLCVAVAH